MAAIRIQLGGAKGGVTLVDPVDSDLESYPWTNSGGGYAMNYHLKAMHRIVLARHLGRELESGETVDHINRDRLDNRRMNLRVATRVQNAANKWLRTNTSGYRGIYLNRRTGLWEVRVMIDGLYQYFGGYRDKVEGAYVRDQVALQVHGEYAYMNVLN